MVIEITDIDGNMTQISSDFYQKYEDYVLIFTTTSMDFINRHNLKTIKIDGVEITWEEI